MSVYESNAWSSCGFLQSHGCDSAFTSFTKFGQGNRNLIPCLMIFFRKEVPSALRWVELVFREKRNQKLGIGNYLQTQSHATHWDHHKKILLIIIITTLRHLHTYSSLELKWIILRIIHNYLFEGLNTTNMTREYICVCVYFNEYFNTVSTGQHGRPFSLWTFGQSWECKSLLFLLLTVQFSVNVFLYKIRS